MLTINWNSLHSSLSPALNTVDYYGQWKWPQCQIYPTQNVDKIFDFETMIALEIQSIPIIKIIQESISFWPLKTTHRDTITRE